MLSKYAKGYTAFVGAVLMFWSTYAPTSYSHWLPGVLGLLTAAGVVGVKNTQ